MSLFSWFTRISTGSKSRGAGEPSGLLNADATVPLPAGRSGRPLVPPQTPDHAANRKNERMERRELLYIVVRDAMVRAGVLSASYKFKVLSLDQRGRQFLVMMDLAREYGGETVRLSEIEALIAQTAKSRYDILVSAVYWRINDHVAVGIPQKGIAASSSVPTPQPAASGADRRTPAGAATRAPVPAAGLTARPLLSPSSAPAPLLPATGTARASTGGASGAGSSASVAGRAAPARFDPIEADEVAAFKRALANAASTSPVAPAAAARPGVSVRSGPLLQPASSSTGFEDTEMPGSDSRSSDLSTTQYGDLN